MLKEGRLSAYQEIEEYVGENYISEALCIYLDAPQIIRMSRGIISDKRIVITRDSIEFQEKEFGKYIIIQSF
jgi:hypothetical protein